MKGQKVFTALYDWMLQEYQRQGVTSGKDLVMPVRTVWGWYMKGQGLQNGQRVDESATGHGLMCIVSNAACIRREVPKVDRLVVMADDEVHPTFRVRAEQWIGEEVAYICDVANHPTDAERVAVCAVPRSFMDSLMPSEKNEGIEHEPEVEVYVPKPDYSDMPETYQEVAEIISQSEASVNEEPEPLPAPEPVPPSKPLVKKRKKEVLRPTPPVQERGLFDDFLFEFAKHCEPSRGYVHRSKWSGEMVADVKEGDVLTIYYVGVVLVSVLAYWIGTVMAEHGATFSDFCVVFALMFGAWTVAMLWVNHKVNGFKKMMGRR